MTSMLVAPGQSISRSISHWLLAGFSWPALLLAGIPLVRIVHDFPCFGFSRIDISGAYLLLAF